MDSLSIFVIYENNRLQLKPDQTFTIGRDEKSNFRILDQHVSRNHCSLNFLQQHQHLEIIDTSTNGTRIFTTKGELISLSNKKHTFRKISEVYPLELILADEIEIKFDYVNLKTKTVTKDTKPLSLIVKRPYELSLENIEHVSKILPSAGIAMLRKFLELELKKFFNINDNKTTLQELIKRTDIEKLFPSEIYSKLKYVQCLGNKSLHELTEVNYKTAQEATKDTKLILKAIQDKMKNGTK
ncbi:MAG: FHA domain-containing protein [Leptospiraceae bacterium]|nr:FHA domain-containing protein [Leptospiraceae bacterium]